VTIASNLALLNALRRSGLLSQEQLEALPQGLHGRLDDPRSLARLLVQRGWLSVYQINELLAGRGSELVLGSYHILDRLGRGGQSTVFKARDAREGRLVALKLIRADMVGTAETARRFLLELEALVQLDHPHIVQFWDADQIGDALYCAMEFIAGTDLGKHVQLTGPLAAAQACDYVGQAALGLQHAHEHSLIHRDIKPANLMLTGEPGASEAEGCIKILDWGLAGLRPPSRAMPGAAHEDPGGMVGTADYLSPEQAVNSATVDIRGDLYSLGCTFYYLLTGSPPFPGGKLAEKILRHQQAEPAPVLSLRPDLPAGLGDVLKRLLAKRPEDRFQTPAALALALAPYCRGDGSAPCLPPRISTYPHDDTPIRGALRTDPSIALDPVDEAH